MNSETSFELNSSIHKLKHYLPSQGALKDFIHHNTLHAFQHLSFFDGLNHAYETFGYKVTLTIPEFIGEYRKGRISENVLDRVLENHYSTAEEKTLWKSKMLAEDNEHEFDSRIGLLRENWKTKLGVDMDAIVYTILFRLLSNYLDQGISIWKFPNREISFLEAVKEIESNGWVSIFRGKRAKSLLKNPSTTIENLLELLIGKDSSLYEQYLFDQQFEHQGWSGFVASVEDNPIMLLDHRSISTKEVIFLECLLEIDALDYKRGEGNWKPLENYLNPRPIALFSDIKETEVFTIARLWQEAYEWSYYFPILKGIADNSQIERKKQEVKFQMAVCIDDRECSWRQYVEQVEPQCETYGTPGFFGLDMVFKPEGGKFYTKVCPAPMPPHHLVKEIPQSKHQTSLGKKISAKITKPIHHHKEDIHFSDFAFNSVFGWISAQFIGFLAGIKLVEAILFPKRTAATASAFNHMEKIFPLSIENKNGAREDNFLLGFTKEDMTNKVFNTLSSIGLTDNFAPFVYIIGHGSTSTNNPYYAGYDCGACSGRAGSVNARVFSSMANNPEVRERLKTKGIVIPDNTLFMGGLHDTTQDVVQFYDKDDTLSEEIRAAHIQNKIKMREALLLNAKERSRRFDNIDTSAKLNFIHKKIKQRAVSYFEPRPEYNHATNALCIVGRRKLTQGLFLDRRSFLNSYDYSQDPSGQYLRTILNAAAPVCGGINLEYFFSRTDNQKLGAGSKLPHNVMGLYGVANGIEGDLRPGLPAQMIEIHEPVRLLVIVEQYPEVIIDAIQSNDSTYEWFINDWIHLICYHPTENKMLRFSQGKFTPLDLPLIDTPHISTEKLMQKFEMDNENLPVYIIQN